MVRAPIKSHTLFIHSFIYFCCIYLFMVFLIMLSATKTAASNSKTITERIGEGSGCCLISGIIQAFSWSECGRFNFQGQSWNCNFLLYSQALAVLGYHFFVNDTSAACFDVRRSSSGRCFYTTVALHCTKSSTCFTFWGKAHGRHWIGSWTGPITGLDIMEKRKIVPVPGIKLRPSSS